MDNYYLQICPNVDACSPGIFIPKKLCYFLIMFINFLCNMVSLWLFKKNVVGYGYVPFIYIKNMQKPKDSTTHPIQGWERWTFIVDLPLSFLMILHLRIHAGAACIAASKLLQMLVAVKNSGYTKWHTVHLWSLNIETQKTGLNFLSHTQMKQLGETAGCVGNWWSAKKGYSNCNCHAL